MDFMLFRGAIAILMLASLTGCGDLVRGFIFAPEKAQILSTDWTRIPAKTVHYMTPDGLKLQGWYWQGNKTSYPLVVHLHGTSGHMGISALYLNDMIEAGYPLFIPEYRGYGPNPGKPSFKGLELDGQGIHAAAVQLANEHHGGRIVLLAHSLGSGVAIDMAHRYDYHGLILVSPFTSMKEAAPEWAANFIHEDFKNLEKLPEVKEPRLIIHGEQDKLVQFDHGQQLFENAPTPAALVKIQNAGHRPSPNHLIGFSLDAIRDFERLGDVLFDDHK